MEAERELKHADREDRAGCREDLKMGVEERADL